jgi:predicted phosphodiesterase
LELGGLTLWLIHDPFGWYVPSSSNLYSMRERNRQGMAVPGYPDVIVFGHEHSPSVKCSDGILFVNSGSPTFLDYRKGLGTVAILTIDSGQADAHVVRL